MLVNDPMIQKAAFVLSFDVLAETLNHVFDAVQIGISLKSLDLTAFTLVELKQGLQRVEKKVDKLLFAPLLDAIDDYNTAFNELRGKEFDRAVKTFEKVIDNAKRGFNQLKEEKMNLETFKHCVVALKLIISSKIYYYSYKPEEKIFIPCFKLSKETKEVIASEIKVLAERCMSLRQCIKVDSFLGTDEKMKEEAQDLLDNLLKISYPYMSEGYGWTKMDAVVSEAGVKFDIMPQYLPFGAEDFVTVKVGVIDGSSIIEMGIWRSEKSVCVKYRDSVVKIANIDSDSELVTVEVDLETKIDGSLVLSSDGKAVSWYLGEFKLHGEYNGHPFYIQRDNFGGQSRYLYNVRGLWYGSSKLGDTIEPKLYNRWKNSQSIPRHGWQSLDMDYFANVVKNLDSGFVTHVMKDDPTLIITPGTLTPCELKVKITGVSGKTVNADYIGQYVATKKYSYGKIVYENDKGKLLYVNYYYDYVLKSSIGIGGDIYRWTWNLGSKVGEKGAIFGNSFEGLSFHPQKSRSLPVCPSKVSEWMTPFGPHILGAVKVVCSVHI